MVFFFIYILARERRRSENLSGTAEIFRIRVKREQRLRAWRLPNQLEIGQDSLSLACVSVCMCVWSHYVFVKKCITMCVCAHWQSHVFTSCKDLLLDSKGHGNLLLQGLHWPSHYTHPNTHTHIHTQNTSVYCAFPSSSLQNQLFPLEQISSTCFFCQVVYSYSCISEYDCSTSATSCCNALKLSTAETCSHTLNEKKI